MSDLGELFNQYGSDKSRNGYAEMYQTIFLPLKDQEINMLEIGIGTMIPGAHSSMFKYSLEGYKPGGSLRAWRDFFPKGRLIGADIQEDTQFEDEPRIETYLCNSSNSDETFKLLEKLENIRFDIIIDDGSHWDQDQLNTLRNFYPHVKEGGFYIVEDVGQVSEISGNPRKIQSICPDGSIFYSGLKNNLCVIHKKKTSSNRENY